MKKSSDSEELLEEKPKAPIKKKKSKPSTKRNVDEEDDYDYSYGNDNVMWLRYLQYHYICYFRSIKAISLCIFFAVIALKLSYDGSSNTVFATTFNDFWNENSLIYVLSISVPALLLYFAIPVFLHFLLLYYKWDTVFSVLTSGSIFYCFSVSFGLLLQIISDNYELPLDNIALGFIVWNISILALLSMRWKSPNALKKIFLIISPALISVLLINFLSITLLWMVIIIITFWDIFAVLYRYGPLNLIIQILDDRDASSISAGLAYPLWDHGDDIYLEDDEYEKFETAEEQMNKDGPELGLGDFFVFSLFIGIISLEGNWLLTFICYFAIIFGMFISDTVILMGSYYIFPALPFPVFCGMTVYYLFKGFIWLLSTHFVDFYI